MKTRNKLSVLAGVAALALVGTGYAAWNFSKDANTAALTGTVSITGKAAETGTLEVAEGTAVKLVLDQKSTSNANGVYWADASGNALSNVVLKYTGAKNVTVEETINVTVTPTYTGKLAEYVTIGSFADVAEQTWNGGTTALDFTFTLPTVEYTAKYPLNEAAYDTMVTDLASATISFAFAAEVDECTHIA